MTPNLKLLQSGARSVVKKAADAGMLQQLLDGGSSLLNKVDLKNPLHTGAIGAGVGALGGAAGSMLGSDDKKKSPLRAALMGGLAGGGIGAGAGSLNAKYNPATQPGPATPMPPVPPEAEIATAAPAAPNLAGTKKLTPPAIGSLDRTQPRLPPAEPLNIPRAATTPAVPASPQVAVPSSLLSYIKSKRPTFREQSQPAPVLAAAD